MTKSLKYTYLKFYCDG